MDIPSEVSVMWLKNLSNEKEGIGMHHLNRYMISDHITRSTGYGIRVLGISENSVASDAQWPKIGK